MPQNLNTHLWLISYEIGDFDIQVLDLKLMRASVVLGHDCVPRIV